MPQMTMAKFLTIALFIISIGLFVIVGFDIVDSSEFDLVAIGLAAGFSGLALDRFVP